MKTINATFDGRTFIPEEPVDLPVGCKVVIPVPKQDETTTEGDHIPREPSAWQQIVARLDQVEEEARASGGQLPKSPWEEILAVLSDQTVDDPAMPTDFAEQHDHYLYGAPKRPNQPCPF